MLHSCLLCSDLCRNRWGAGRWRKERVRLKKTIPTVACGTLGLDDLVLRLIMEWKKDFYIPLSGAEGLPYRWV